MFYSLTSALVFEKNSLKWLGREKLINIHERFTLVISIENTYMYQLNVQYFKSNGHFVAKHLQKMYIRPRVYGNKFIQTFLLTKLAIE